MRRNLTVFIYLCFYFLIYLFIQLNAKQNQANLRLSPERMNLYSRVSDQPLAAGRPVDIVEHGICYYHVFVIHLFISNQNLSKARSIFHRIFVKLLKENSLVSAVDVPEGLRHHVKEIFEIKKTFGEGMFLLWNLVIYRLGKLLVYSPTLMIFLCTTARFIN